MDKKFLRWDFCFYGTKYYDAKLLFGPCGKMLSGKHRQVVTIVLGTHHE